MAGFNGPIYDHGSASRSVLSHRDHRPHAIRWLRCVLAVPLMAMLGLTFFGAAAAQAAPSVSIGTVSATFYPNPNNSPPFDSSQLSSPLFTLSSPVIDWNPTAAAQVSCSNSTGVNEETRPFTNVIPNPDGTCSTQVAQANGLQAGVNNPGCQNTPASPCLFTFEAVFEANLTVSAPAQVTLNLFSDDGWILGVGPGGGGGSQPAYISGELLNTPATTAVKGYQVVGGDNTAHPPTQEQVTVNFPSAGSYPIELDYTEVNGDGLALVLGSTAGNPILPGGCSTTPTGSTWPDVFPAEMCQIAGDEGGIIKDQEAILGIAGQLPNLIAAGSDVWTAPLGAILSSAAAATIQADTTSQELKAANLGTKIGKFLAEKLLGEPPCATSVAKNLLDAANDDAAAALETAKAAQAMSYAMGFPTGTTLQEVQTYLTRADKDLFSKLENLITALLGLGSACEGEVTNPTLFETGVNGATATLQAEADTVAAAAGSLNLVPSGGYLITGVPGGLGVTIDPQNFPLATGQFPIGVPSTGQINPSPLSGPLDTSGVTAVPQTGSIGLDGTGFASRTGVTGIIGSTSVRLGTTTTDANGNFSMTVQIPATVPPGLHELEAIGSAPDGSLRVIGASITVTAHPGVTLSRLCIGTVSGTFNGGLEVPPGAPCTLDQGTVNGTVTVDQGAIFDAESSTINGGVAASAPTGVELCGDRVNGSVTVQNPVIPGLVGSTNSPLCALTKVTGTVSLG